MSNRRLKRIRDYISLFLSPLQRNFWCFWVKIQDDIILFFANCLLAILKLIGYAALFLGLILMLGHFCLVDIHISRARITLQSQCPEPAIKPKPAVSFKTQAGQL
ncbi:hypothetical protein H6F71_26085 [Microcoleus sp. FACHB-61]|nr:hypothetical protein [Microcoleus sp. FACHB-61]